MMYALCKITITSHNIAVESIGYSAIWKPAVRCFEGEGEPISHLKVTPRIPLAAMSCNKGGYHTIRPIPMEYGFNFAQRRTLHNHFTRSLSQMELSGTRV